MLMLSAAEGRVNERLSPKITGYVQCSMWLIMGRKTSASKRNVAVSDQSSADTLIIWPPCDKRSPSILVKGQGPAIHEARASRNTFPEPASSKAAPGRAFHLPSGEQGRCPLHGTLPLFSISKVFAALPTFTSVIAFTVYRTRTFVTFTIG